MAKFIEHNYKIISNFLGVSFLIYIYSMLFHPLINGGWTHLHKVWYHWQALNVGVLAFAATVILFNISRYQDNQQKHRELIAARAFLPEALSELTDYCKASADLLQKLHLILKSKKDNPQLYERLMGEQLHVPVPPPRYREVFSKCIPLADPHLSKYLSYILVSMQTHNSRLVLAHSSCNANPINPISYRFTSASLVRLCELHQFISNLLQYSRGEEESFFLKPLTIESINVSILSLNLVTHEVELMNLADSLVKSKKDSWRLDWDKK